MNPSEITMETPKQISNAIYEKKFEPLFRVAFYGNGNREVSQRK
jgi:hypothetical protein